MLGPDRTGPAPAPAGHDLGVADAVDEAARQDFVRWHGAPALPPVAVVMAAYQEAANIARVLAEMPEMVCGVRVTALVVVDGGDDGTDKLARGAGALAVHCGHNRGQGAALRLGYRLAREHGARFIVTLDADGQYDPSEMAAVLGPVVREEADFVSGSRRLGVNHQGDSVRRLGVIVFAALISALCRHRVTDPSNGFRAMRADLLATLTLEEDQYQASELLVSALRRGWRAEERPVTMRRRSSGASKKGGNLRYGYQFCRVILRTWWRER